MGQPICYTEPTTGEWTCFDDDTQDIIPAGTPEYRTPAQYGQAGNPSTGGSYVPSIAGDQEYGPAPLDPKVASDSRMAFQPRGAIVGYTPLPNGGAQVRYANDSAGRPVPPDTLTPEQYKAALSGNNEVSANTLYSAAQTAARQAESQGASAYQAQLARNEQARQFNETMGYNKSVNDQNKAQTAAQLEKSKGDTLLGLGQRPDTLIKYLYALRGQQTPQAINGTTTNLPGYQNVIGQPNPQGGAGGVSSSSPSATLNLPGEGNGIATPPPLGYPGAQNVQTNQNLVLAAQNPAMSTAIGLPNVPYLAPQNVGGQNVSFSPLATNAQGTGTYANSLGNIITNGLAGSGSDVTIDKYGDLKSPGQKLASTPAELQQSIADQEMNDANGRGLAKGGMISEPMIAVGLHSGRIITLGENAPAKPETVVPQGKTVQDVQDRVGKTSYATGGSLGYDPSNVPSLGSQSSEFFNNPYLKDVVSRGYNSSPSTPLFPQIGIATGGGQSLIPSVQRLNSLLPSEQQLYAGALQDEFGANPEDAFAMSKQLSPQVSGLRTPRFAN